MAPQEESKLVVSEEPSPASATPAEDSENEAGETAEAAEASATASGLKKKKKSKKGKGKKSVTVNDAAGGGPLPKGAVDDIIKHNPALASEWQGKDKSKIEDLVRSMKLQDLMTGMVRTPCFGGRED
jgi:glycylpeptide N-tetradecanoyltransferase